MIRKTTALLLALLLPLTVLPAARASGEGLFGELSRTEGADERLALLEEAAEPVNASRDADRYRVEVCQAYYEGNRVYVSYRYQGEGVMVRDGLALEGNAYADIFAGEETPLEDGTVVGWKECAVPEDSAADPLTLYLVFGPGEEDRVPFTVKRHGYEHRLRGSASGEYGRAEAEVVMGKVDVRGFVRLASPKQAADWTAWLESGDEEGADAIVSWNLWRDGAQVAADLYGASSLDSPDVLLYELMFPVLDDLHGLSLVPEYSAAGEKPEEGIPLSAAAEE